MASIIKRTYASVAQALPSLPLYRKLYQQPIDRRNPAGWRHWLASLGAVHHLDRMIALDIPWWNVAATEVVASFLRQRPQANVFEYGSGASSVWLARRAANVITVEHVPSWAARVSKSLLRYGNARLIVADLDVEADKAYTQAIEGLEAFDLIIIDGRLRSSCLEAAIAHLKTDGMILFDDSGRRRYRTAIANCGLVERRYFGRSYCVPYPDHTSLLARDPAVWG